MKYFALLGLLMFVVACGSKAAPPTFASGGAGGTFSTGGTMGRAGTTGTGLTGSGGSSGSTGAGEAGEAGAGETDELAPTVEITSPSAVTDPNSGTVLTGNGVTVTCSVTPSPVSGAAVLVSSIKIQMFGSDGKQIGTDGSVMSGDNANEYSAHFVLNGVATGAVSFACSASDQSSSPHVGSATLQTFYDGGPTITLSSPTTPHSLGPVLFSFSALPTPLTVGDTGAAVDTVTLSVNGVAIKTITQIAGMPGYYQSSLDLSDPSIFTPTPVGSVPIVITATNKRGTIATQNDSFVVDSTGPIINIISPPTSSVVFIGGQTTIQFTVTDETGGSGVNPASVEATVNTSAPSSYVEGPNWHSADGKTFFFSFNTLDYPSLLGVSITIAGYDNAGNQAQPTTAFYYLDNVPPVIDMQPPNLQERDPSGSTFQCSEPFDPLGVSPNDKDIVPDVNIFRALLWDEGNSANGQGIFFFSDIDPSTVRLYFQSDSTKPLVKNHEGTEGGVCNDIADTTLPSIPLTVLAPTGSSFYDKNAPLRSDCDDGSGTQPPLRLCNQVSDLTRVIQHEVATTQSVGVVYAFQPDNGALCTGGQFQLTTKIAKDGWICASVYAKDKIGNPAVSAPLRLCLDAPDNAGAGYVGTPPCATGAEAPPLCVPAVPNDCVPPPHFSETEITIP